MQQDDTTAGAPPLVVIDTTAIRSDLFLTSVNWTILLDRTKRGDVRLFVPEVVLQESARHARRTGGPELRKGAEDGIKMLQLLGFSDLPGVPDIKPLVDKLIQEYPVTLRARFEESGGQVLPLPATPHPALLERDLSGRKPFKGSGDGYRDALIWESVLELCRAEPTPGCLMLVTGNHTDFCDHDGDALAAQLTGELPDQWSSRRIKSVRELVEALWPRQTSTEGPSANEPSQGPGKEPDDEPLGEESAGELDAELIGRIRNAVQNANDELTNAEVYDAYLNDGRGGGLEFDLHLPWGELQGITVEAFYPDEDPVIILTDTLTTGQRVFDVRQTGTVQFEAFMFLSEAMANSEDDTVSVLDWQWNDAVSRVSITRECCIEYVAFDDPEDDEITVEFQRASSVPTPDR